MSTTTQDAAPPYQAEQFGSFIALRGDASGPLLATREEARVWGERRWPGQAFTTGRVDRPDFDFAAVAVDLASLARARLLDQVSQRWLRSHRLATSNLEPPAGTGEDPPFLQALEDVLFRYFGPTGPLRPRGWVPAEIQAHRAP